MGGSVTGMKKSKMQLIAAVVFGLMIAYSVCDELGLIFGNGLEILGILGYRGFFDVFLYTMLFVYSLALYVSKPSIKIDILLGMAIAMRIFYTVRIMYFNRISDIYIHNDHWNNIKLYLPKFILVVVWLIMILTIFRVVKTRIPAMVSSFAGLIIVIQAMLSYLTDYFRFYINDPDYHKVYLLGYFLDIIFWAAVFILTFSFLDEKLKITDNKPAESIEFHPEDINQSAGDDVHRVTSIPVNRLFK